MNPAMAAFVQWCKEEREAALRSLPEYESGRMEVGRIVDGVRFDETPAHIEMLKRIVENMTNIIEAEER